MKQRLKVALAALVMLSVTACSGSSPTSDVVDLLDTITESTVVTLVRTGSIEACPSSTLGEMADAFMSSPQWSDFVSDSGETVVELEGGISFDGMPATARFQFVVDEYANTFNTEWLGINGEGQGVIMMSALLGKMCDATY